MKSEGGFQLQEKGQLLVGIHPFLVAEGAKYHWFRERLTLTKITRRAIWLFSISHVKEKTEVQKLRFVEMLHFQRGVIDTEV